jgi:hypothetical protein
MNSSIYVSVFACTLAVAGCADDKEVDSDEEARRAYLGLDKSIENAINLGFQGFNTATNANIAPQTTNGAAAGTITVSGQVDQGISANKEMRLSIGLVNYDDGAVQVNEDGDTARIVYNTDTVVTNQPYLEMKLMNIPTGTLTGSLSPNVLMTGVYRMTGDIEGTLAINVSITGTLMAGPNNTVLRVPGTTIVVGTATNQDGGVYDINVTL